MKYFVAYAVYAVGVTALLVHLLPPRTPLESPGRLHDDAEAQVTMGVVDDYFMQPCTVKLAALAADSVMFNNSEEYLQAREHLGC